MDENKSIFLGRYTCDCRPLISFLICCRQCYRKVACRCSQLFFCLVELANIEPMYQYSLQWFQSLVSLGIDEVNPAVKDRCVETL